ncbi:phage tail protein [Endozoicomonas sp. SM1973]|uniref:Phage tail protein n=1 Tax=Spartinivicinus marinus TaxID=2994442 RepID=A0A853HVL0_9GAMM|nr:phage tail protein [Spartinivicinus marinus]MCX4026615.1 phage tail protein [Spartinivicinus marinus]NYZ64449.1 phage tail protein [Spartinivicinus marinus]
MENKFYSIFTDIGKTQLVNATALGLKLNISKIKIGDGGDDNGAETNPKETDTDIVRGRWEGPINDLKKHPKNDKWLVTETIIPDTVGNFYITEFGLYDDQDNLIVIGKYPKTYKPTLEEGSASSSYIKVILELANTDTVQLKVDPTVMLASKEYVDQELTLHKQQPNPHPEYLRNKEKATDDEINAGLNDKKYITPLKLKSNFKKLLGLYKSNQTEINKGDEDNKFVTPKKISWGFAVELGNNGYIKFPSWLSGLIIQWGEGTAGQSGDYTVIFPISFPNHCSQIVGIHEGTGCAAVLEVFKTKTKSSVTLRSLNHLNQPGAWGLNWIAIGY